MKDDENRLTFGEVMSKSLVSCFFSDSQCRLNIVGAKTEPWGKLFAIRQLMASDGIKTVTLDS